MPNGPALVDDESVVGLVEIEAVLGVGARDDASPLVPGPLLVRRGVLLLPGLHLLACIIMN